MAALGASLALTISAGFLGIFLLWRYAEAERSRAETERTRAEADYEVGRAALAEILDLGERSIEPTVIVTRDRVILMLQAALSRILELARRRPNDPAIWNLLAVVGLFLGRNLEYQGRLNEGESLYSESLTYWEKILAKTPGNLPAMYRRWQTLQCLGRVLEEEGKARESASYWERAITAGELVLPMMPDPDLNSMAVCRMALAKLEDRLGDQKRAIALLEANMQMLRNVPAKARTPGIVVRLSETWGELRGRRGGLGAASCRSVALEPQPRRQNCGPGSGSWILAPGLAFAEGGSPTPDRQARGGPANR